MASSRLGRAQTLPALHEGADLKVGEQLIADQCNTSLNVGLFLDEVNSIAAVLNRDHYLNVLYHAGVVSKRRSGVHIFYRITNDSVVAMCKTVCQQTVEPATASTGT
jgi:hypothetical protein